MGRNKVYHYLRRLVICCMIWGGLSCTSVYAQQKGKIKIVCIGASITQGATIKHPEQYAYPAQLQALLGAKYVVNNLGVNSCTLLNSGNKPYTSTKEYRTALETNPAIVFIDLGGNDSKLINRVKMDEFEKDYHALIRSFTALPSRPRIILLLPVKSFVTDTAGIWDPVIVKKIIPAIQQVAYEEKLELVNLYSLFSDKPERYTDKIHPDAAGATMIAKNLARIINQQRDTAYDIINKINIPKTISSFYGYTCAGFEMNGRNCKIAQPKRAATGHPWVWRARFWGHEPQADIALLELGFHIVYCDVAELFGNKESVDLWNKYYQFLQKNGLAKKTVLEAMSRGGVYAYNWAAENPGLVAAVYADNPVLDLKSWPGNWRKDKSAKEWEVFKKDYGFTSDEETVTFSGSPIDKVKMIVKGKYPMLHICADEDEAVLMEENTIPFEKKIKALGGNIRVIHKPGFKHHPHSLPDPEPIVDFMLKATGFKSL